MLIDIVIYCYFYTLGKGLVIIYGWGCAESKVGGASKIFVG